MRGLAVFFDETGAVLGKSAFVMKLSGAKPCL